VFGNFLGIVRVKFIAYFDEEISDFRICCGRISPVEIEAYF
jgi:hypothetical protein